MCETKQKTGLFQKIMHDRFYILFTFFFYQNLVDLRKCRGNLSRFFGANETNCGEHPVITIIQRLHRTIANVEELRHHLVATYVSNNVNVHIFEHLKLQRQVSKYSKENASDKVFMNKMVKFTLQEVQKIRIFSRRFMRIFLEHA